MSELRIDHSAARLLVVDVDSTRRSTLAALLVRVGYGEVLEAAGSADVRNTAGGRSPDLVLIDLDASAPEVDGVLALEAPGTLSGEIPVLGITDDATLAGRRRAASLGIHDFLLRPVDDAELRLRVDNALASSRLRRLLTDRSARLTAALRARSDEQGTLRESLSALAAMADYHDDDGDRHAQRVGIVAAHIARALDLPHHFVEMIGAAAPLHDIGKVGISRRILLKPGRLTAPEWLHMMRHVEIGAEILASASSPVLMLAAEIARTHHEHWDGSGYSARLREDEIPLSGRIVAVADVWDTLTHNRPYRPAWEPERALAEIHAQAGRHFDPRVVAAFATLELQDLDAAEDAAASVA